jgi:ParB-like chromosome segregation protein Spo0J
MAPEYSFDMTREKHFDAAIIPIGSVKPHPDNPRRGDVALIVESLTAHGQFRPIVVNKRDNLILCGSHTHAAAKRLKWTHLAAVVVDVDEDRARRILLADKRTSDLASYDTVGLLESLGSLPTLDGTGFEGSDIAAMAGDVIGGDREAVEKPAEVGRRKAGAKTFVTVTVGFFKWGVEPEVLAAWSDQVLAEAQDAKPEVGRIIRNRLGIPPDPKRERKKKPEGEVSDVKIDVEVVAIDSLTQWQPNPREGDIGAISESLMVNGQYSPIVIQKSSRRILKGNHTWRAAKWIGWDTIAISTIDVDDEEAARIVLIDNRTSDVAEYDGELLKRNLLELSSFEGTGFSAEDVDEIFRGLSTKPSRKARKNPSVKFGDLRFTVNREVFVAWADTLGDTGVEKELASRAGIPLDACEFPE